MRETAEELLKEESGYIRDLRPREVIIVSAIGISWALFQLGLASFLIIDTTMKRSIHLAFAMAMLFLVNPCLKRETRFFRFLSVTDRIPIIDYLLAIAGALSALVSGIRIIVSGLVQGSRNMMSVALACASAGIIVGVVNMGTGGMIAYVVEVLSAGNIFVLLLITAVASLVVGMGLPTTATYIVMASLTAPIIVEVGGLFEYVIPIMAAHLFCFYFAILADDTPPVGPATYAASAIAESELTPTGIQGFLYDIRTSCIAFMFVFNPDLILHGITSWPQALLLFAMALIGMSAFECFAQGWCMTKNKVYEIPFFLAASFTLFHPGGVATLFHVDLSMKYYFFPLGIAIYGAVIMLQKIRIRATKSPAKYA